MNRKNFIRNCSFTCLGGTALVTLLQSCATSKIMSGKIEGDDLIVPLSDFETKAGSYKQYLVVQNDLLLHPICVYRHNEKEYSALWMQCTHQGAGLQVFGNKLQCPAHGSEFTNKGTVQNGPAEKNLRVFPVTVVQNFLKISLKAI